MSKKEKEFYINSSLNKFKEKLYQTQIIKNNELWFTPKFKFLSAVGLDRQNYKRDLSAKKVKKSEEKLRTLLEYFENNQQILINHIIYSGKSDILWKTIYANDYIDDNADDIAEKIVIKMNDKSKLEEQLLNLKVS